VKRLTRKQEITVVPHLYQDKADAVFRHVRQSITPATLARLRQHVPFCFGVDRQSLGATILRNPSKTGHDGRVHLICQQSRVLGLYLPEPHENPRWPAQGELQYDFDGMFWYIDGENRRSTGFSAGPSARPRLWEAYTLTRYLHENAPELKPKAFIFGELMRLARADKWMKMWVEALQFMGVPSIVDGKELQGSFLDLAAAFAREHSEKMVKEIRRARETMERRGCIHSNQPPWGLVFTGHNRDLTSRERWEVWTVTERWNILHDMVAHFVEGTFRTCNDAVVWFREEHGIIRTPTYVHMLLQPYTAKDAGVPPPPSILTGVYTAYKTVTKPCQIVEEDGLRWDYHINEHGNQVVIVEYRPGKQFPIHYAPGSKPIPPEMLEAARARLLHRGRPAKENTADRHALCIIPPSIHRCARCGAWIEERSPVGGQNSRTWRLMCQCHQYLTQKLRTTREEAKQHEAAQHTQRQNWSVSLPLWEAIRAWFEEEMHRPEEMHPLSASEDERRRRELEQQKAEALAKLEEIEDRFESGRSGPKDNPAVIATYEARRNRELERFDKLHREVCEIQQRLLAFGEIDVHLFEWLRAWRRTAPQIEGSVDRKREVVLALVERVVTDLDSGEWTATLKVNGDCLRTLQGMAHAEAALPPLHETRTCAYCGAEVRRLKSKFTAPAEATYCGKSCAGKANKSFLNRRNAHGTTFEKTNDTIST
jgi:hypothetical protein